MAVMEPRSSGLSLKEYFEMQQSLIDILRVKPTPKEPHSPLPSREFTRNRQPEDLSNTFLKAGAIVKITLEGLASFEKGEYHNFDPCVGDSGCFPRAFMFMEIGEFLKPLNPKDILQNKLNQIQASMEANTDRYLKANEKVLEAAKRIQNTAKALSTSSDISKDTQSALLETMKGMDQLRKQSEEIIEKEKSKLLVIKDNFEKKTPAATAIAKKSSLEDFFKVLNIKSDNVLLPTFLLIIGFTYFLTVSKKPKSGSALSSTTTKLLEARGITRDTTDPTIFKTSTNLTDEHLFDLDKLARKQVAAFTVEWLQFYSKKLNTLDLQAKELKTLPFVPYIKEDNGRLVIPPFFATLLVKQCFGSRFPLFLKYINAADEIIRVFYYPTTKGYIPQEVNKHLPFKQPVIHMTGISTKKNGPLRFEDLEKQDVYELLLENEAVHPQVINWPEDKSLEETKKIYDKHESKGKEGCSLENSSKLFLIHYNIDTLDRLTQNLPKSKS